MEETSSNSNIVSVRTNANLTLFSGDRRHATNMFPFPFPREEDEIVEFDTSDSLENSDVLVGGTQSIQKFASAIPNHLLLGSLLEHLCFVYEKNPQRSRLLFKVIGQRLAAMNLLSPLAFSDEFSTVRLQHNRAFTELLHAASSSLFPQDPKYLNSDTQSYTLRSKEGLFQAQTSRYLSEFEEICTLGKGSYGKVFKVLNKLDGQNYAVKKVHIKNVTRDDCMKVLREVKVLSSLQHANVVGYHTAWMEHVQPGIRGAQSSPSKFPALETHSFRDDSAEESDASSVGSSIVFRSSGSGQDALAEAKAPQSAREAEPGSARGVARSSAACPKAARSEEDYVPCVFLGRPRPGPGPGPAVCPVAGREGSALTGEEISRTQLEINNNSYLDVNSQSWEEKGPQVQFCLMLYIQMQLCELSLRDWILERNSRPKEDPSDSDPYGCVDTDSAFSILRTILEGVKYIHSKGIMHRDLKPRNIFLHGLDCHVRIGDFGLACGDIIVDDPVQPPTGSRTSGSSHTTGVGTYVYASPEQLEGSHYDSKSDMYSVGVVALELFQPFGTEMERVQRLGELRQGKVPESLSERWPALAKCIRQLTSPDPSLRPSAAQLLQSELFNRPDRVICRLQRKVQEQEEEILQLRRQIGKLQSSQNAVQQKDLT